jgi:hypothetical protein
MITHQRFMTVVIKQKADVYQALQTFLARNETGGVSSGLVNVALRTG